jgi:hypothetical protein
MNLQMHKPRRYFLKISPTLTGFRPDVWEHEEGMFIDYDDYASLKAEVERLRDGVETMTYHASGVVTTTWVRAVEYDRLKAEVNELKESLNKLTKTPEGVDGVEVKVSFWTKYGSRLPSSYSTFWMNDKEGRP